MGKLPPGLAATLDAIEHIPAKPPEGSPCNGCGLCCALQPCDLAVELLDASVAPCPAMEFADGRFWCGVVRNPARYFGTPTSANKLLAPMVREMLGIGEGCDTGE